MISDQQAPLLAATSKCNNPRLHFLVLLGICVGILATLSGCGENRPRTFRATGAVNFTDGNPVRSGYIEFIPLRGGPSARGVIDSQGKFTLGTFETADGAIAGDYSVVIVQHTRPVSPEAARKLGPEHEEHAGASHLVSLKYSDRETSNLECTVSESDDNHFMLEVAPQ